MNKAKETYGTPLNRPVYALSPSWRRKDQKAYLKK